MTLGLENSAGDVVSSEFDDVVLDGVAERDAIVVAFGLDEKPDVTANIKLPVPDIWTRAVGVMLSPPPTQVENPIKSRKLDSASA